MRRQKRWLNDKDHTITHMQDHIERLEWMEVERKRIKQQEDEEMEIRRKVRREMEEEDRWRILDSKCYRF